MSFSIFSFIFKSRARRVPSKIHIAGRTYGVKNNQMLMQQDSNDIAKLKQGCTEISCRNNSDFDKLLMDIIKDIRND